MKNVVCIVAMSVVLAGCGMVSKNVTSEATIQDKVAFAIGADPADVKISNIEAGVMDVKFHAEANGEKYRCYFTSAVAVTSDAVCSKMGGGKIEGGSCNALLKAAGKC